MLRRVFIALLLTAFITRSATAYEPSADAGKREHPLADPTRGERAGSFLPSAALAAAGVC